ncbi:transcriptional regulator [Gulosibacter sediminis]|uniref:transcriptional regulator n=1 Tax=Gulosibacter sediminis TaxID=1729695 RepID=UPI0024A98BA2|nr:transcriptional regulator [Gulosibacter sediminis]
MSVSPAFHEEIHAPNRLRILSLLRPLEGAEFTAVREALDLSDANLSKTIKTLAELQYVTTSKLATSERDRRRRTSVRITQLGAKTFDEHVAALRELVAGAELPS